MFTFTRGIIGFVLLIEAAACTRSSAPAIGTRGQPSASAALPPMLIQTMNDTPPPDPSPEVARQVYANVDLGLVQNMLRSGARVRLALFDLPVLTLRIEQRLRRPYGETIVGTLEQQAGEAIITRSATGVLISLRLPRAGDIQVSRCSGSVCVATQFKTERDPRQCGATSAGPAPALPASPPATAPAMIDILVLYTNEVARHPDWGASALARGQIALRIDEINRAFACSDVNAQVRLVDIANVAFTETGNVKDDLETWVDPATTEGRELADRRDKTGADLVSVVVEESNAADFGYAKIYSNHPSYKSRAVSVSRRDSLVGRAVLAHEVGHNFGAGHSLGSANSHGYQQDSHGCLMLFGAADIHGTLLADIAGPILRYSNPHRCYQPPSGYAPQPTGVPGVADNARTLNLTAPDIETFRQSAFQGVWDLMQPCETAFCPR